MPLRFASGSYVGDGADPRTIPTGSSGEILHFQVFAGMAGLAFRDATMLPGLFLQGGSSGGRMDFLCANVVLSGFAAGALNVLGITYWWRALLE